MFSVEYTHKYHSMSLAIPCENEEKANEVYKIIKDSMGKDAYELNKLGKSTTVEFNAGCGTKTLDVTSIAAVWIADTANELSKQWREEVYDINKRYK